MTTFESPKNNRSPDTSNSPIALAKSIMSNEDFRSSCSVNVRESIQRFENHQEVSPLSWEYVRAMAQTIPDGEEKSAIKQVIDLFVPEKLSSNEAIKQIRQIDLSGLERPFVEAIDLFVNAFIKSNVTGTEIGINESNNPLSVYMRIQQLQDFNTELDKLIEKIKLENAKEPTPSVTALTSALEYRSVLARYQIDYLEFCADNMQHPAERREPNWERTVSAKILHLDFADKSYGLALQNPALPKKYSELFMGPSGVIPDVMIPVLEDERLRNPGSRDLPDARELHNFHFIVLETMRNYGELIAGTGPSISLRIGKAVASLDPDAVIRHVKNRNQELTSIESMLQRHSFGRTLEGVLLREFITALCSAGELFIRSMGASGASIREYNRQIDIQSRRIIDLVNKPECPKYFSLFFQVCCKSKVPKLPG